MSFAEFGASTSAQKKRQAQQQQRVISSSPSSGNSASGLVRLDTISESLLQYQVCVIRNFV